MLFNSFIFFIFLSVVFPVFLLLPSKGGKNIFLLAASYFFYGYWDWRFCLLLAASTVIDFLIGRQLSLTEDERKRKHILLISLGVNLGILGFFKYFNFFISSFQSLGSRFGLNADYLHLNIILPVGVSFYTFQSLSYTIDVYRNRLKATSNFIDFALFVAFFPQLVAGPIERASHLLPQISQRLQPNSKQIKEGIVLIITGLFRKVMIGDTIGKYVDHIFGNLSTYRSIEIICGLILFSIQIYADFSGYSHIARGTAKLFGVELMKNFEQPYLSRNITEFWRRWHISFSGWLKDYLYIPLGGNRKGTYRTYFNLLLTMFLGGLWHGASWNFAVWGILHGIYLAVHKLMIGERKVEIENIHHLTLKTFFSIVSTYFLVLFTWIFFRSTSWETTQLFFSKIFNWEYSEYTSWFITTTLTFLILMIALDIMEYVSGQHDFVLYMRSIPLRNGILTGLFMLTLLYMFQTKASPFIYFKF